MGGTTSCFEKNKNNNKKKYEFNLESRNWHHSWVSVAKPPQNPYTPFKSWQGFLKEKQETIPYCHKEYQKLLVYFGPIQEKRGLICEECLKSMPQESNLFLLPLYDYLKQFKINVFSKLDRQYSKDTILDSQTRLKQKINNIQTQIQQLNQQLKILNTELDQQINKSLQLHSYLESTQINFLNSEKSTFQDIEMFVKSSIHLVDLPTLDPQSIVYKKLYNQSRDMTFSCLRSLKSDYKNIEDQLKNLSQKLLQECYNIQSLIHTSLAIKNQQISIKDATKIDLSKPVIQKNLTFIHQSKINQIVDVGPRGNSYFIATVSLDKTLKVWDIAKNPYLFAQKQFSTQQSYPCYLIYIHKISAFALGFTSGEVHLMSLANLKTIKIYKQAPNQQICLLFYPTNNMLYIGGNNCSLKGFNLISGEVKYNSEQTLYNISSMAIAEWDEHHNLYFNNVGQLQVFNAEENVAVSNHQLHTQQIIQIELLKLKSAQIEKLIITLDKDGNILITSAESFITIRTFQLQQKVGFALMSYNFLTIDPTSNKFYLIDLQQLSEPERLIKGSHIINLYQKAGNMIYIEQKKVIIIETINKNQNSLISLNVCYY